MRMLAYVGLSALVGVTLVGLLKARDQWAGVAVMGGFVLGAVWMAAHRWWTDNRRH